LSLRFPTERPGTRGRDQQLRLRRVAARGPARGQPGDVSEELRASQDALGLGGVRVRFEELACVERAALVPDAVLPLGRRV
jgi:hypothetical protein